MMVLNVLKKQWICQIAMNKILINVRNVKLVLSTFQNSILVFQIQTQFKIVSNPFLAFVLNAKIMEGNKTFHLLLLKMEWLPKNVTQKSIPNCEIHEFIGEISFCKFCVRKEFFDILCEEYEIDSESISEKKKFTARNVWQRKQL